VNSQTSAGRDFAVGLGWGGSSLDLGFLVAGVEFVLVIYMNRKAARLLVLLLMISSLRTSSLRSFVTNKKRFITMSISENALNVRQRIEEKCTSCGVAANSVQLIPVSKTKPKEAIMELYDSGFRHFGENYFQELLDKAAELPPDIQWHFIGHLQSSKSNRLIRDVPNLCVVETVDTLKLANKLHNACEVAERPSLNIYIQVDTSGEDSKSGVSPSKLSELVENIQSDCSRLNITGLMTIGAPGDLSCFDKLSDCRNKVADFLKVDSDSLALSMGMSGDFEDAIVRGSTSVRVGSTIFGARDYPR